jgi:hypothetical protein
MQNITTITLTGADEHTDLEQLRALVAAYPCVEIGLLYTTTPEGRCRYPSREWLIKAARTLSGRVALHVCGADARRELREGYLVNITAHAPRVQVNGRVSAEELPILAQRVNTLITQHNQLNEGLLGVPVANHALLIDGSGGRGVSPSSWGMLDTPKAVGRAGGLGPDNLADELRDYALSARPGAWVDMENKLRKSAGGLDLDGFDWFDIEVAQRCAEIHHGMHAQPGG